MNFQRVSSVSGSDDGIVVLASELRMMLKARPDPESKSRRESLVTSTCVTVSHAVRGEGTRCRNSSTVRAAGDLAAEIRGALSRNGRRYFTSACHAGHAASGKHLVKRNYGEEFCFPPKDSAPLQSIHPRRRWQAGMLKHCSTAHEMDKQASRIRRVRRLWRRSTFKQSLARKSFANKTCASSHGLDRKFSDHSSASTSAQANGMGKMTTEGNIANDSLLNVYIQQSRLHLQSEPDPEPTVQAIEPQLKCQMQMCIEGHVPGNLVSMLGDAQLPGWSAHLILCLGGGATAAKPLACASRHTASSLLRDAVQLSAELRPIAQALVCASDWGCTEEVKFSHVHDSTLMLSVLTKFDIASSNRDQTSVGPEPICSDPLRSCMHTHGKRVGTSIAGLSKVVRRRTKAQAIEALRDSKANFEQVRVHRVGCLLANLAQRARSLSIRLVPTRS